MRLKGVIVKRGLYSVPHRLGLDWEGEEPDAAIYIVCEPRQSSRKAKVFFEQ